MHLQPLGDQAILATFSEESAAFNFARAMREANWPWLQDVVPAYFTVGVFFDASAIRFADAQLALERIVPTSEVATDTEGTFHRIPVCYEHELDLARVAEATGLDGESVIREHTSSEFRIYAIGFVPGFPYMGYLPEQLAGVPRLASPRMKVEPGSVGITGKQTGIYPLPRPGGWNILGRTPLTIVDLEDEYFPLRVGDRVRFERIDETEFQRLSGERL